MFRRAGLLVAFAACNGGSSHRDAQQGMDDAAVIPMIDAPPACMAIGPCEWLDTYQRHIVAVLAGAEDITPGVKIAHRASIAERNAARQFITDAFSALGYTPQRHDYTSGNYVGANVYATLDTTGTNAGTLVVGAHFDGVPAGPAAADNATGVAMVLAIARYLKDVPVRQHKVIFVAFDQEENGLIGSREFAKTLANQNVTQVHVYDMVSFDGDGDHTVELWSPSPTLQAIYEQHGPAAGTPISAVPFEFSDHQAFLEAGFVTVGASEEFVGGDHTPHYHTATDTYAMIQFDYLARVTHLAFAVLDAEVQ